MKINLNNRSRGGEENLVAVGTLLLHFLAWDDTKDKTAREPIK